VKLIENLILMIEAFPEYSIFNVSRILNEISSFKFKAPNYIETLAKTAPHT
jgi:hypothetical protein